MSKSLERISKGFWIWGQFNHLDSEYLLSLQENVRKKLNGPKFVPHLTLTGPYDEIKKSFESNLRKLSKIEKNIKLTLESYSYKESTYEAFFITLKKSTELEIFREKILQLENSKYLNNLFMPHISLAYGKFDNSQKFRLKKNLSVLKKTLVLDTISIVKVDENKNIWNIVKKIKLNN